MSELVNKVNELLNEEKWTRATLNSYTINHLSEMDTLLDSTEDPEVIFEIKKICDDHLVHTKNSVIALYLSGIISIKRQVIDDGNLIKIINIFSDNHKWNIVEFICNRILTFGENIFALRTLADCYEHENEKDKKYEIWKRLIKVDYEEADIVRHLAEIEEEFGKLKIDIKHSMFECLEMILKRLLVLGFSSIKNNIINGVRKPICNLSYIESFDLD